MRQRAAKLSLLRSISWLFDDFRSLDNKSKSVDESNTALLVHAVSCAADPSVEIKIHERRRMLVEAIAILIRSDDSRKCGNQTCVSAAMNFESSSARLFTENFA